MLIIIQRILKQAKAFYPLQTTPCGHWSSSPFPLFPAFHPFWSRNQHDLNKQQHDGAMVRRASLHAALKPSTTTAKSICGGFFFDNLWIAGYAISRLLMPSTSFGFVQTPWGTSAHFIVCVHCVYLNLYEHGGVKSGEACITEKEKKVVRTFAVVFFLLYLPVCQKILNDCFSFWLKSNWKGSSARDCRVI